MAAIVPLLDHGRSALFYHVLRSMLTREQECPGSYRTGNRLETMR